MLSRIWKFKFPHQIWAEPVLPSSWDRELGAGALRGHWGQSKPNARGGQATQADPCGLRKGSQVYLETSRKDWSVCSRGRPLFVPSCYSERLDLKWVWGGCGERGLGPLQGSGKMHGKAQVRVWLWLGWWPCANIREMIGWQHWQGTDELKTGSCSTVLELLETNEGAVCGDGEAG